MSIVIKTHNCAVGIRDRHRNRRQKICESIEVVRDINYANDDDQEQTLDIYIQRDSENLGTIINVHGGSWVYGNKEIYSFYSALLSQYGFAVVNINYRLAPKHTIDSQLEDVNSALNFIEANGSEYNLNTENVFLVGDSAGAHLVSLYMCILNSIELQEIFPFVKTNLNIRAMGLCCGTFDFNLLRTKINPIMRPFISSFINATFGKGYKSINMDNYSTLNHIDSKFPATFLITSKRDFTKFMSLKIKEKLVQHNIRHEYDEYRRGGHIFHLNLRSKESTQAAQAMCDFFKEQLHGPPPPLH